MKHLSLIIFLFAAFATKGAAWQRIDSTNYESTVDVIANQELPKVNYVDAPISTVIASFASWMPVPIDTSLIPQEKLKKRITIKEKDVTCIEMLALIADSIDADILISEWKVILIPSEPKAPSEG